MPLRWADAAVVAVVCDPTQDVVSLVLDGAAVVVVSEPTRDVSLALDGADRRWDRRRRLRADAAGTDRRWSGGLWGGTGAAWADVAGPEPDAAGVNLTPPGPGSLTATFLCITVGGDAVGRLPSERAAPSGRG